MKKNWIFIGGLLPLISLSAVDRASSLQEGIEIRRIAEYCKEKNYSAVKTQIHNFFNKHPVSESNDALWAMLGDILFSENDFLAALTAYDHIKKQDLHTKTEFRRIHCLHALSRFKDLITATRTFLSNVDVPKEEQSALHLQMANALFRLSLTAEDQEEKKKYLHEAKAEFKLLHNTGYADQAVLPLAHIHTFLKEYPQAVSMYRMLIEKDVKNKEEYLLQILQLQLRFDRSSAIETCERIYELGGAAAPQAAFNQLSLFFQEKRYRDIAHFQERTLKHIAKEQLPIAHYYIGRSLFHMGDHAGAAVNLEKYLSSKSDDNPQRTKNALLTVLQCAKEMDNFALFEKTLFEVKTAFPHDEETVKAILLHSQLCRNKGKASQALQNLKDVLESVSDLSQRDNILYDYALLHFREQHWMDSACAFEKLIKQFPAHPHHKSAWRHLIHCRLHAIKEAPLETAFVKKEELIATLQRALKEHGLFSAEERRRMRYILAKTFFENQKYERTLGELVEYVKDYHDHPQISDAYLMMALSHFRAGDDLDLFTAFAEQALSLQNALPDASKVHLSLFNTYLACAERAQDGKNEILLKAADHLYQAFDHSVKKENQLWLANFYFHQYSDSKDAQKEHASFFLDRSIAVLEKILQFDPAHPALCISKETLDREGEAVKLSDLYADKKKNTERISLLETLTSAYKEHPDWAWKYQRLAQFHLASAFKEEKQWEKALETYAYLIASSSHANSYFATAAQLEKATLEFVLLDPSQQKENAKEIQEICDVLKELEIKRKLYSEPCHLEAALTYIDILTSLASDTKKVERRLELLNQMQQNFSSREDPLVAQYLSASAEFPEKHLLYQQYMCLVALETLSLEAQIAQTQNLNEKALELQAQANDQLLVLLAEVSEKRLKERVEKSKAALEKLL